MIRIDPEEGVVVIELPDAVPITIDLVSGAIKQGEQQPLFIDAPEAETLARMIDYILGNVRIKPESKEALSSVRPRLDSLFHE
jgi:hypothetical protein